MNRRLSLVLVLWVAVWALVPLPSAQAPAADAEVAGNPSGPGVEIRQAQAIDHGARLDYRFVNALDADILARIDSGTEYRFKHRVELLAPRRFWLSRRRVLAEAIVETGVEFDALTQSYSLTRMFRMKMRRKDDRRPPAQFEQTTDSFERMRAWMTEFEGVEVYDPSVRLPDGPLKVRVEATFGRKFVAWVFPSPISAGAERRLER